MSELTFEWDEDKARQNEAKHGISFEAAKTVFSDPLALTIPDPSHSHSEDRWLTMGYDATERLLVVWHIERADNIRIIGCRRATKSERNTYVHG